MPDGATTQIVIWDNIGNTLLGVQPADFWSAELLARLEREQPGQPVRLVSYDDLLHGYPTEITWLYNPQKAQAGFRDLYTRHSALLRDANDPATVAAAIQQADILILHKERVAPELVANAPHLRLIQHLGQDSRGVPLAAARARDIPVAAIPLVNYLVVAEHTWALILNHYKQLPQQRALMQSGAYAGSWGYAPNLRYLADQTLGLLGLGEIARPLARFAQAFGMTTYYWDQTRFPELEAAYGLHWMERDELLRQSDILSLQLALNPQTEGIIGAREIGLLKPTAFFVNTARGRLVDQAALTAALRERRIGGAALEVFADEPLPTTDPLLALHDDLTYNVTLTPHSSSIAPWSWLRDSQELWDNVRRHLQHKPLHWLI